MIENVARDKISRLFMLKDKEVYYLCIQLVYCAFK